MKISINGNTNTSFHIYIPTGILLNRGSAFFFAPGLLKKHGVCISGKQAAAFVKVLNQYRRNNKDWVLVEVKSADGTFVKITL